MSTAAARATYALLLHLAGTLDGDGQGVALLLRVKERVLAPFSCATSVKALKAYQDSVRVILRLAGAESACTHLTVEAKGALLPAGNQLVTCLRGTYLCTCWDGDGGFREAAKASTCEQAMLS